MNEQDDLADAKRYVARLDAWCREWIVDRDEPASDDREPWEQDPDFWKGE